MTHPYRPKLLFSCLLAFTASCGQAAPSPEPTAAQLKVAGWRRTTDSLRIAFRSSIALDSLVYAGRYLRPSALGVRKLPLPPDQLN